MFEKVRKDHILQAIYEYNRKGLPNGFGPSSTYDLIHEEKHYPPKAIIAYANFYAEGKIPDNNFKGGEGTPAFKLLENFGFKIEKKMNDNIQKLYELKDSFLKEWPIERLKNMTLEEYTNLDKETSFCYWVEAITDDLGGIWGGSSYKFGIFKRKDLESDNYNHTRMSDGEYAWYGKYGDTKELAFEKIKELIIRIANYSNENQLEKIDHIDLGDAYKWKIALLYGNFNVMNIFKKSALIRAISGLGLEVRKAAPISELNKLLLNQKPVDEDYFEFSKRIWDAFGKENDKALEFEKWLKKKSTDKNSNMISSYLRAINILITHFQIDIYDEDNISVLEDLYEDLILHQRDSQGKYRYAKSKSYGEKGFYSAAVKKYIEFLNDSELEDLENEDIDNDFIESISAYNKEELQFYFNYLDEIVAYLGLKQGDERVVYSCKGLYLNFNIGQRFAWRLEGKKDDHFLLMTADKLNDSYIPFDGKLNHFYIRFKEPVITPEMKRSSFKAFTKELNRTDKSGMLRHNNQDFERAVFDKSFREQFIKTISMEEDNVVLNKILFGPPGTGKTYNTINESLKIADPDFYKENEKDRQALNKRFKELLINNWDKTNGQIAFCTFHQSFSYEDFVEGIKPKINKKNEVYYDIEEGVFKKTCQLADSNISAVKMKKEGKLSWDEETFKKASFFKLSLGDSTKSEDKAIYDYCIENNVIALGYGDDNNFGGLSERQITEKCEDLQLGSTVATGLNYFIHYIKNGNYIIIGNGNKYVRALAKVVDTYKYDPTTPISYNHFRNVEWIFKDEKIPIEEIYNRGLSQQTIYKLDDSGIKKEFFVNHGQFIEPKSKTIKNYVLIIDEINRGNVSSIFGELITLIEKDKRAGGKEELEVTLPYSKESFKVPHNVFIVGTMNTADRSIEALDTALRRRFAFDEMPPKPELIVTEGQSGEVKGIVDGINLKTLLETINKRIEKLIDKDHKIGHSYFLKVNDKKSLVHCFENEVIPLLEEYFFGDYGKIGLVLGDSFVTKDDSEVFEFAQFEGYDTDVSSDLKERSVYKIRRSDEWDFNTI